MTGQFAVDIAKTSPKIGIPGVALTKFDSDPAAALPSPKAVTACPLKFVGVGEKMADFEPIHPDRPAGASRMGDIVLRGEGPEVVGQEEARNSNARSEERLHPEDWLDQCGR
jgi:signal recognition particle subunit SRP54